MFEIYLDALLQKPEKAGSKRSFKKSFLVFRIIDTFAFINVFILVLTIKQIEKISKALGDQNRLKILHYISNKGGSGPCSGIQHVVDLAQPSISHHVKILIESGLIEPEKDGRNHTYTLNKTLLDGYKEFINHLQP